MIIKNASMTSSLSIYTRVLFFISMFSFATLPVSAQLLHERIYSLTTKDYIAIYSSLTLPDGSLIMCGNVTYGGHDGVIIKIDPAGSVAWAKHLTNADGIINCYCISLGLNGTIWVSGNASFPNDLFTHAMLLNFSTDGNFLWGKRYNVSDRIHCTSHYGTKDGGAILLGNTASHPNFHGALIMKIRANGEPEWCNELEFNGFHQQLEYGVIIQLDRNDFLLAGREQFADAFNNGHPGKTLSLLHLASDGSIIAEKSYSMPFKFSPSVLLSQSNGYFFLAGTGRLNDSFTVVPQIRFRDVSSIESVRIANFLQNSDLAGMVPTASGYIGMTHFTEWPEYRASLFTTDTIGEVKSIVEFDNTFVRYGGISAIRTLKHTFAITTTGVLDDVLKVRLATVTDSLKGCGMIPSLCLLSSLVLVDTAVTLLKSYVPVTTSDFTVTITALDISMIDRCSIEGGDSAEIIVQNNPLVPYPNPAFHQTDISIVLPNIISTDIDIILYDLTGREVYRTHREAASAGEQIQIPTSDLASGVYTVEIVDASNFANVWRGKVIIQ